jgi:uncharacterized protein DUF3618
MGQTTIHQIEAQIDRTREQLGSNLHELSRRVDAATDWQEYYRAKPFAFLGAAAVGGAIAAVAVHAINSRQPRESWTGEPPRSVYEGNHDTYDSPRHQVSDFWRNVQAAVVGLAAARLKDYIATLLPGFDEHYQRVEHRASDGRGGSGRNVPLDLSSSSR